jgi:hypothetical protein
MLNINFNLYNDVFEEKNEFKGQMGIIGILNYEKINFSCFLVLKTGKFSNFALDTFFVPPISAGIHLFSPKVQV